MSLEIVDDIPKKIKYVELSTDIQDFELLNKAEYVMIKAEKDKDLFLQRYSNRIVCISIPNNILCFFDNFNNGDRYRDHFYNYKNEFYDIYEQPSINTYIYENFKKDYYDKAIFKISRNSSGNYLILEYLVKRDTIKQIRELEKKIEKSFAMNRSLLDTINMFHSTEENILK